MIEKTIDIILLLVIGGAIAWMLKTRLGGDAPGGGRWGCWDTTYNAPPLGVAPPKAYLYRFYSQADLQT